MNEEHHERHVKPVYRGRVISTGDGLRSIKARDDKEVEDDLTRSRKALEAA